MSETENVRFFKDLASSEVLKSGFVAAGAEGGFKAATAYAVDHGYSVTEEGMQDMVNKAKAGQAGDTNRTMSDDELDGIAGGSIFDDIADYFVGLYNKGNNASGS